MVLCWDSGLFVVEITEARIERVLILTRRVSTHRTQKARRDLIAVVEESLEAHLYGRQTRLLSLARMNAGCLMGSVITVWLGDCKSEVQDGANKIMKVPQGRDRSLVIERKP
jgi:hypothetical protein